jgi:hypothetical protein
LAGALLRPEDSGLAVTVIQYLFNRECIVIASEAKQRPRRPEGKKAKEKYRNNLQKEINASPKK